MKTFNRHLFQSFVATLAVLAVCFMALPSLGAGMVRWRVGGEICMPVIDSGDNGYIVGDGLTVLAPTNEITCPVPTGSNLVELNDTNTRLLKNVYLRTLTTQVGGGAGTTTATLYNYDFDGTGLCICDADSITTIGYGNFTLQFAGDADDPSNGCGTAANQCGAGWTASWLVEAHLTDSHPNTFLNVKLVGADDT